MHPELQETIDLHEAIVAEAGNALIGYETEKTLANVVLLSEIPTTYDKDDKRQVNAGNLLLRGEDFQRSPDACHLYRRSSEFLTAARHSRAFSRFRSRSGRCRPRRRSLRAGRWSLAAQGAWAPSNGNENHTVRTRNDEVVPY